jgi:muconolactone delta-isomerase
MRYMINCTFSPEDEPAIIPLLPQETNHVKELIKQGSIETVYVSTDGGRHAWIIAQAVSKEEVLQMMATLPFYPYMKLEILKIL